MSNPFIGEIRMFGGNFAPVGWAFCDGSLIAISENETLFQLIGTSFGGDGQSTFGLPDLRGRAVVHQGPGFAFSQAAGSESVTLGIPQIPAHSHNFFASADGADQITGNNGVVATPPSLAPYFASAPDSALNPGSIVPTGGSQPHENMQPFLTISFIISLYGIFPSQT